MAGARRRYRNGSIRQLPNGRYQLRLKVPGSLPPVYYPHPRGTFEHKQRAEAELAKHNAAIEAGTWRHPDEERADAEAAEHAQRLAEEGARAAEAFTFDRAADEWLAALERGEFGEVRRGTLVTYRSRVAQLRPEFGSRSLATVTPSEVTAWFDGAALDGKSRAVQLAQILHRIAVFAAERHPEIVAESPVKLGSKRLRVEKTSRQRELTDEAVRAIADRMPGRYSTAVLAAGWLGLRLGEALALKPSAFGGDGTVRVSLNAQTKGGARVEAPKTRAGVRVLPIPRAIRDELTEQAAGAGEWLFPAPSDPTRPIPASTFGRYFAEAVESARAVGVDLPERVTFHDLRHTALTRFARTGATGADIRAFGGHEDAEVSARYQHSQLARLTELADRL